LICAGYVVSDFQKDGLNDFFKWFSSCPTQFRLFVPGNHEIIFELCPKEAYRLIPANITLLEDYSIEYDSISFYAISAE
jgi:alpha-beta hydrolase superfamily lysophospholipase